MSKYEIASERAETALLSTHNSCCATYIKILTHTSYLFLSAQRKSVAKGTVIFDFKGISMKQFTKNVISLTKIMIDEDTHHYPNSLREMVMINVPSFFAVVWRLLKPIIPPDILKKISIFGSGVDGKNYIR